MQTSLLLPLILIATNGPGVPSEQSNVGHTYTTHLFRDQQDAINQVDRSNRVEAHVRKIFDGCRPPVQDPRKGSKILFQNRVENLHPTQKGDLPDMSETPLFISRCGSEFVLFHRHAQDSSGETLYLRFEEGSFELIDEVWG